MKKNTTFVIKHMTNKKEFTQDDSDCILDGKEKILQNEQKMGDFSHNNINGHIVNGHGVNIHQSMSQELIAETCKSYHKIMKKQQKQIDSCHEIMKKQQEQIDNLVITNTKLVDKITA